MGDEDVKPKAGADRSAGGASEVDSLEEAPATGDSLEQQLGALLGAGDGPAALDLEGRVIAGKYRLEALLGEGGMGQVYRATHLETGGLHAVKLLLPGSAERARAQRRFQLEARNAASLLHPNTVRTTDFGADGKLLYLVMEYVDGEPLEQVIAREGHLPWRRAVPILAQVLKALWEAHEHERRIIHRDIKPANILVCETAGTRDFVKVADFGISRALEGTGLDTQGVIGTPTTMAPELWRGDPIDARTDLYALGCTAYHMLAGRRVFHGVSGVSLGYHHLHEAPAPLADVAPAETPAALIGWVERMMAKDPDDRFASASKALEALVAIEAAGPAAPPPARRRRGSWVLLAIALAALIGAGAALGWRSFRSREQPDGEVESSSPVAPALSATPRRVPYHHCAVRGDAGGRGSCSEGFIAWCGADERPVACCMSGMVPVDDNGICDCAPGGTDHPEALANGCPPAPTAAAQREAIRASFRSTSQRYKACYDAGLQTAEDRRPQGTLVLGLEIGPSGAVYKARVQEGSLPAPSVQRCILEAIERVRFPPPANGWMKISYPLSLRLSEDDDAHR